VKALAAGTELGTKMYTTVLGQRGATLEQSRDRRARRRPVQALRDGTPASSELEGGTLRLGMGRPLWALRMQGSVALLQFEGAEERLGACEEGQLGLPAG
jgi:hypothetical protein